MYHIKPTTLQLFCTAFSLLITNNYCISPTNIISRSEWGARHPNKPSQNLTIQPTTYVIVHQRSTDSCYTKETCLKSVKQIQEYHMDVQNKNDIKYNFLFGEDGNIYEGVGWNKRGQHTPKLNHKTYGIAVIGTFNESEPRNIIEASIENCMFGVISRERLIRNVRLVGHVQVAYSDCPGGYLYRMIRRSLYWYRDNLNIYKKLIV